MQISISRKKGLLLPPAHIGNHWTLSEDGNKISAQVQQATSPPNWDTINDINCVQNHVDVCATGDLPSELEHTQALLPCYQRYQLYPKSCWCRCNRRPPLKIGAHKHCYHVINDINCVQNLMLMYVQQAESPPNEIRSLKICHHPILGLQLMQWLQ